MAHVHRHGRFILRAARWLPAALAAGLMLWLAHYLANRGPRPVVLEAAPRRVAMTAEQRTISDELDALETRYRVAEAKGELAPEWEAWLSRAVSRQNELLRLNRYSGAEQTDRLERLETARDNLRAGPVIARIASMEEMSGDAVEESQRLAQWREALALQIDINRSRAAPRFKDFVRETQLKLRIEAAEAAPLRLEVDAALEAAQAAAEQSDWIATLQYKRKAHEVLTEINRRFPRSTQADIRLQARLGEEIVSLKPAAVVAEAEAFALGGDTAMAAGRFEEAAEFYASARVLQEKLNREHDRSRFASAQRLEEWEANRQTALARVALGHAVVLGEELNRMLLQRRLVAAGRRLEELRICLDEMKRQLPRSRVRAADLRLKAAFLARQWEAIDDLHERCYGMLVPVPGVKNLLMARNKVSQEFYAQIMGTNPSRLLAPTQPVDSVTWADAAEFCRRLSWLLGTVVRLPSDREFLLAAGAPSSDEIGFHDLRGNMVEWLEAGAEAEQAFIAGGNFAQAPSGSGEVALNLTPKTIRGRPIGFRFVVEYVLE